jgi:PKD repeat protein
VDPDDDDGPNGRSRETKLLAILALVAIAAIGLMAAGWFLAGRGETTTADASPEPPTTVADVGGGSTPTLAAAATSTPTVPPPTAPPPPAPAIDGPGMTTVGQPVSFASAGSTGVAAGAGYSWDFGDGTQAQGSEASHVYDLAGQFVIRLTISNPDGQAGTGSQAILVQPSPSQPPQAKIGGPSQARVGQSVTFSGSGSVAGSAPITRYAWVFGDGTRGEGQAVSHAFAKAGNFVLTLTVVDANGLAGSTTWPVTVQSPQPPQAVIRAPASTRVGETVTFDGGASTSGAPIVAYLWTFGDGGATDAVQARYAYDTPDNYQVTLTVIDQTGARNMAQTRILVEGSPSATAPKAAISGPATSGIGQAVTYSGAGSKPGSSPIARYDWTLSGPGSFSSGTGVSYNPRFDLPGAYTVSLLVTDQSGLSDSANMTVTVSGNLDSVVWYLDGSQPPVTLSAKDGKATGSTGCNTYQLTYTALGGPASGDLTVSQVTSTQRTCPGFDGQSEARYFDTLQRVTSYRIDGNALTLSGTGGTLVYTGRAPQGKGP